MTRSKVLPPTPASRTWNPVHVHAVHATILYVTAIDHEQAAYNYRRSCLRVDGSAQKGEV